MEHLKRDERLTEEDEKRMRQTVDRINKGRMPFEGLLETPASMKWLLVICGIALLAIAVFTLTN